MSDDSIAWTSFRTLEPNPYPYTPMTQSILERGVKTSSLVAAARQDALLTTFHRGYLYFNVDELRRQLNYFVDIPMDVLVQYFRDETDVDLDRISVSPSLAGIAHMLKMNTQFGRVFLRGLTIKHRLPDRPPVEKQSNPELLSLMDTHLEFLTEMVSAHILFSGLAEAYAVGIERAVSDGPSRQRVQNLISSWTHSKTSEMARWAANLETDEQRDVFLETFGHRCPREMEIAVPRWHDDPSTLRRVSPRSRSSPDNADPMGKLSTMLARVALYPGSLLEQLRENPKNEWLKSYAYLRKILVEVGRRATAIGYLATSEDIFYLRLETARQFLDDPPSRNHTHSSVSRAKSRHERNRAYSPPLFVDENFLPVERKQAGENNGTMRGLGVSGGRVSGRAITARSPEEVDLSDGSEPQVLVTEFTDAGWTPLFFQIDGLVMEYGSLLSHGSIVAREAGISAVVNVDDALERIGYGDWIEVNGAEGVVRLTDI
jgi:phosphohistidine swiveling domain-containing protein